jgi:hypothetical protein
MSDFSFFTLLLIKEYMWVKLCEIDMLLFPIFLFASMFRLLVEYWDPCNLNMVELLQLRIILNISYWL